MAALTCDFTPTHLFQVVEADSRSVQSERSVSKSGSNVPLAPPETETIPVSRPSSEDSSYQQQQFAKPKVGRVEAVLS